MMKLFQKLIVRTKGDISTGGLLVPQAIILPVVSVIALTCFIIYISFIAIKSFLNNIIINDIKKN